MRDASVGFQCPTCVAEGAKSTRAGLATYGGKRSGDPTLTTKVLIALNVGVWAAIMLSGRSSAFSGGSSSKLIEYLALRPRGLCSDGISLTVVPSGGCAQGALWRPGVADGAWWQLVTSEFTHIAIWHLALNMMALWIMGPDLEARLGRSRFLAVYFGSGLASAMAIMWWSSEFGQTIGASGCMFGMMAAELVLIRKVRGDMQPILRVVGINALITVLGSSFISWQGHLGGFLGGLAITAALVYAPRARRTLWQAAGTSAVLIASAVAIVARILQL
jgi:membrane associated rhomboid family serine protease